jgi:hypothetical protein
VALVVAAARAAVRPALPLRALADELREEHDPAETDPDNDLWTVFSWSYRTLSRDAARLFRLLGLHPGPDISITASAGLAALTPRTARAALAELARSCLIREHLPGRYAFHDLRRVYARRLAYTVDAEEERRTALRRVHGHHLHTAYRAALLLNPGRDPITVEPLELGARPDALGDADEAMTWFGDEHAVLMATLTHDDGARADTYVWQTAWTLADFLDRRGHWHDEIIAWRAAVAATRRLADVPEQARAHRLLARAALRRRGTTGRSAGTSAPPPRSPRPGSGTRRTPTEEASKGRRRAVCFTGQACLDPPIGRRNRPPG